MKDLRPYIGREDVFAYQYQTGYTPERRPLTDADLLAHLNGKVSIGTYTNVMDKARYIVWDVDYGRDDMGRALAVAQRIKNAARALGFSAGVEFSGHKGYHVWVLFEQWELAHDLRRIGKAVAETAGFTEGGDEVFPKQDVPVKYGSLVKLPFGVHAKTGQRSRFLGPEPTITSHPQLEAVLAGLPPDSTPARGPSGASSANPFPCLASLQEDPPGQGERHNCAIHWVGHMRRAGLEQDMVEATLDQLIPDWRDPDVAPTAGDWEGGPTCNLSKARHCPPELCVQTRRGVEMKPGSLRHAAVGARVWLERGPDDGSTGVDTVRLIHPDIDEAKARFKGKDDGH
jgi:hypothetical protein